MAGDASINTAGYNVTLNGTLSGNGTLTKQGAGTLMLTSSNAYSGGTTLGNGILQLGNAAALGANTAALIVNGGTVDLNSYSATIGPLSGLPAGVITDSSGSSGTTTLAVNVPGTSTYPGAIVDGPARAVAFTQNGPGMLIFSGNSSYSGSTTVSAGTLQVNGSLTGTGAVVINSGATLSGSGSLSGTAVPASGGHISPVAYGTTGALTLGGLAPATGSLFDFDLGTTSASDMILISGAGVLDLTGTGTLNLNPMAGFGTGTYTLFNYGGGTLVGSAANFLFTGTSGAWTYTMSNDSSLHNVDLIVGVPTGPPGWITPGAGNWFTPSNWSPPTPPNSDGAQVILGPIGTPCTITLDSPVTTGQLTFNPGGAPGLGYTISGNTTNTLTMTNGSAAAVITVSSGKNTINAPLSYTNSLNLAVGDTAVAYSNTTVLSISGAVTGTGSLTKDGLGLLALGSLLSISNSGSLLVNAGSMTTTSGIVDPDGAMTVGLDVTHTAVVTAKALKVYKLVLSPGSKVVLGTGSGGAGSAASDQSLLDAGLSATNAGVADISAGGTVDAAVSMPASTPAAIGDVAAAVPEPSVLALLGAALSVCSPAPGDGGEGLEEGRNVRKGLPAANLRPGDDDHSATFRPCGLQLFPGAADAAAIFAHQHADPESTDVPAVRGQRKWPAAGKDVFARNARIAADLQRGRVVQRTHDQRQTGTPRLLDVRGQISRARGKQNRPAV